VIAGASHASFSALGSFRQTASEYSINGFSILLKPDDRHRENFVANSGGGSRK